MQSRAEPERDHRSDVSPLLRVNAHGVHVGPDFATNFQAAALTADREEADAMAKIKVGKAKPESKSAVHVGMALGFVSAPKPVPAINKQEPEAVKVTELERQVLHAVWNSQYHDGRWPVESAAWTETAHLGRSAQGAVASCVKKGWLQVTDSGTAEASQVITAAGAAAIGMPSTREEWEKSKAARISPAPERLPEPAAGATQPVTPAAGAAPEAPVAPGAPAAITGDPAQTATAAKPKAKKAARSKEPKASTAGKALPCTGTARCRCAPDRKSCLNQPKAKPVVTKTPESKA